MTPKRSPPSSGPLQRSGYYSDSVVTCLNRQASDASSIQDIEEEKVQQLKQVSQTSLRSANAS